ncbi:hypothetical protein COU80_01605 [Candidatus Peregrinibacteria bacterium CG10_big_fil_rev_8_21_14_0_10_55_24]|nr:MAG: hypothetical protein COU80_01605 [Candidatus Peregrinibacteria bacterium CG10_big_fil_rev_8_21_14_0_10_55_24]
MGLPRTFVGFSSADIKYYRLMQAWKTNEHIDFSFTDCQLPDVVNSENEDYVKRKCRERINMAGKFIQLIGENTRFKRKYVRWEAEAAIEKGCTMIGVNLNGSREHDALCPSWLEGIGAIFIPFSPAIVKYSLENYKMFEDGNYHYKDSVYTQLGYPSLTKR